MVHLIIKPLHIKQNLFLTPIKLFYICQSKSLQTKRTGHSDIQNDVWLISNLKLFQNRLSKASSYNTRLLAINMNLTQVEYVTLRWVVYLHSNQAHGCKRCRAHHGCNSNDPKCARNHIVSKSICHSNTDTMTLIQASDI